MNKENLSKAQDLIKRVDLSNQSIVWWENEIAKLMEELDKVENSKKKKDKQKTIQLLTQLEALLPRGRLELNTIDKLEVEVEQFLKNEKETKQNPKKGPRK
jgi:hypothetical protein